VRRAHRATGAAVRARVPPIVRALTPARTRLRARARRVGGRLDADNNVLSGSIPSELGACTRLISLCAAARVLSPRARDGRRSVARARSTALARAGLRAAPPTPRRLGGSRARAPHRCAASAGAQLAVQQRALQVAADAAGRPEGTDAVRRTPRAHPHGRAGAPTDRVGALTDARATGRAPRRALRARRLSLENNALSGPVPTELGACAALTKLCVAPDDARARAAHSPRPRGA
jgi:hypothetical protein